MKVRRIVLLLLLVSCVTILIGGGAEKEITVDESSFGQLECEIIESMPAGLTNQGGYVFNYQCGKGKDCRSYGLRNVPGTVLTPVLWKDKQETFLDVNLPECPASSSCPWIEVIKISTRSIIIGETTLSYGINKDEYKDEPDAYRKKLEQETKLSPFITIIRGTVADAQKKPIEIAIRVSSYVGGVKPYRLTYEIAIVGKSEAFQILRPGIVPAEPSVLGLIWEAPASKPFFEYLYQMGIKELSAKVGKIVVDITAREIEVEESKLLIVVQGTKRIAATTAPAYRPKD